MNLSYGIATQRNTIALLTVRHHPPRFVMCSIFLNSLSYLGSSPPKLCFHANNTRLVVLIDPGLSKALRGKYFLHQRVVKFHQDQEARRPQIPGIRSMLLIASMPLELRSKAVHQEFLSYRIDPILSLSGRMTCNLMDDSSGLICW